MRRPLEAHVTTGKVFPERRCLINRGRRCKPLRGSRADSMNCSPSSKRPASWASVPGPCGTGFPTTRSKSSSTATAACASSVAFLIVSWRGVRLRRGGPMEASGRSNRDFSKGPVWDPTTSRWLVEIRYPDGSRRRKRLRRERDALRMWAAEQTKIETGAWDRRAPKHVTFEKALEDYRAYSKVQHRSHAGTSRGALACGSGISTCGRHSPRSPRRRSRP